MRIGREQIGPRGFLVLGVAGVAALAMAVTGYGHGGVVSGNGLVSSVTPAPGATGTAGASGSSGTPSGSTGSSTSGGSTTTAPPTGTTKGTTKGTATGGGTTTTTAPPSSTPAQTLGPPLSSSQYAPYAYQIYPGTPSQQAQAALSGIDFHVTPGKTSFTISVGVAGGSSRSSTFPNGDKVYVIEASFGDDSGSADYSYGDDNILETNAAGRIVQ
ncbi:MAG: hypothetical protein M0Z62_00630 [Actinomycetota bacterium]|nr:hypothetical protein [Actinomycetota bacterium]